MRRGRTLLHVAIERLESIKFRQMVKLNPFILCHPGPRIETVVEEVTSAELVQLTQRKKEEERVRATLAGTTEARIGAKKTPKTRTGETKTCAPRAKEDCTA